MIALLCLHLMLSVLAPALVRRLRSRAFWVLALAPAATAAWTLTHAGLARAGVAVTERWSWVPELGIELAFRLDPLAWLLCLVVSGIGALVLVYCSAYFEDDEPGLGRFAGCLLAFAGAMFGLVTSDDMFMLYLFWELTTVLSYLLVGHRPESRSSRAAATQALVVTTFGGLAMLVGIVLIGHAAGTYRISEVLAAPPTGPVATWAVVLLLVGALSKSALLPFHFWLPGAMAAPTPVSAYLHAAAMVKAGIYLVARFAPGYADLPVWRWTVLILGGATMLLGAYRALRQHDLKLLLAFGTVSQLGFLVLLVGAGTADAALAGTTLLLAHALYKAALFLTVGAIDHATGTRDLRELSGLRHEMPMLAGAATVAAASMAGLPPLLGFVGKEAAYASFTGGDAVASGTLAVIVAGSVLTVAYSARFVRGAFRDDPALERTPVHRPGPVLVGVPLLLALATIVLGPASPVLEPLFEPYATSVPGGELHTHLGLWHGLNLALGLSVLTWLLGAALDAGRTRVEALQRRVPAVGGAEGAYRLVMRGLDRGSLEVTSVVQRGSLPLSLGLILTVLIALGGVSLLVGDHPRLAGPARWADSPAQVVVAVVVALAAIAAVRSRRRLRAVFLVGATGYGLSLLFLLHGAPDLALTQVLVETLSIVVFVLVLRRLPGKFDEEASVATRVRRALFGGMVGVVVTGVALMVPLARTAAPASVGMAKEAVDYGGGNNIVNVILVDIRAWDTMGELSVVLAAATGIASLIFLEEANVAAAMKKLERIRARRRTIANPRPASGWLAEEEALDPRRRSVVLEVVARLVFHAILLWSVYLLLAGHNEPGGGFAAGLVAGLAILVRYLAGGRDEMRASIPVAPGVLLGTGLFLSAGNGLVSMLAGGDVLQSWVFDVYLPLIGKLHIVTTLAFDVGVYLVVIGLVLDILRSLGAALDKQIEDEEDAEPADGPAAAATGGRR